MAKLTATFETGVNGDSIATTDEGSGAAFDIATHSAFGTLTYSNAQAASGTLSMKSATNLSGGGSSYVGWSSSFGIQTEHYGRLYLYLPQYEGGATAFLQAGQGTTRGCRLDYSATGKIQGSDSTGAALFTLGSVSIALNQWVRIEYHFVCDPTVGQAEVKLFNTAGSTIASEVLTGTANKNTLDNHTRITFGAGVEATGNITSGHSIYLDNIVANAASYPGPYIAGPVNTVAPVASGTTTVGETLSVTDGTWT